MEKDITMNGIWAARKRLAPLELTPVGNSQFIASRVSYVEHRG